MRPFSSSLLAVLSLILLPVFNSHAFAGHAPAYIDISRPLVGDRHITIITPSAVSAKRNLLVHYLWGKAGFPKDKLPSSVKRDAFRPDNLPNLERVDTLHIDMGNGIKGLSHHFIPKRQNNRLVILHLGHTDNCSFNDNLPGEPDIGMRRTITRLLAGGFSVLGVYMPQVTPEDCRWEHDRLFTVATTGSPMKFFLEPTVVSLNYLLRKFPRYRNVSMIGLSGGGWTTTLCAAIDPRIRLSIPVAGTLPLYLRWGVSRGDIEQNYDSFYQIAGYLDLYVLGSYGPGRKQIQVLNRHDDCCFGESQHNAAEAGISFDAAIRQYEARVKGVLKKLGSGSFQVHIDEKAPRHMISDDTLTKVILPALR